MENELPKRKSTRLNGFDYNTQGAYFITICTDNRTKILSKIVGVGVPDDPFRIELSLYGKIADKYINQLNDFYDHINVDNYVIMPNHIHIILFVLDNGSSRTPTPTRQNSTVSKFVSTLKRFCNKEYGDDIWQRHFNDHIIRNRQDYEEHIRYIHENPMNWRFDELYGEE